MKNKILSVLQSETNLTYNTKSNVLFGVYKGYYTYVQAFRKTIIISFPVKLTETYTITEMNSLLISLVKDCQNIKSTAYNNNSQVQIRYEYKTVWKSNANNILNIINKLVESACLNSLTTCCPMCGENNNISPLLVNKTFIPCCHNCNLDTRNNIAESQNAMNNEKNNVLAGIVGAFLGSLIGAILWIVVGLLGYIAAICGLVLAICTIKGYILFGGKLDKKGIAITLLITIFMIYASEYCSLGLDIYNEFKVDYAITVFDAIKAVPDALIDADISRHFYLNLALGYLFTIISSFSLFRQLFNNSKSTVKIQELV